MEVLVMQGKALGKLAKKVNVYGNIRSNSFFRHTVYSTQLHH